MHIDEFRALFGLSRAAIKKYKEAGIIPPPHIPNGCKQLATYGTEHVAALRAYRALKDNNTYLTQIAPFLREEQITIVQYAAQREDAIRERGLGVH